VCGVKRRHLPAPQPRVAERGMHEHDLHRTSSIGV
jgi:hypothetical protein